jgi:nitroimidazol reductase NimA-like FMN-containing flavoprotein (pyridoxamine 5'-phosphate oxidase superfamily)
MATDDNLADTFDIDLDDCLKLLRAHTVGRFAVARPGEAPLVVPVNYLLDGDAIMFRTATGTKLERLRDQPVAFQLDEFDYAHQTGWSVLVTGVAYEATHFETDHLELPSWSKGAKTHWVRVVPASITGRRLVLPAWERSSVGYL